MIDPIEALAEMYPTLANGQKHIAREVKEAILEMQARLADLESTLQRQPLPEAPASINVRVVDPSSQMDYLITIREARAAIALIELIPEISAALTGLGLVAMDAYIDGRRAERAAGGPNIGPNQQGSMGAGVIPAPGPTHQAIQGSDYSFRAKSLIRTMEGDKVYYKVKEVEGGQFAKFGVTIWPEALAEAGFDLDTLGGVTPLTGYTAHYILNENGKPAKVIGLEPA